MPPGKEVNMVTWTDLFQFIIMLVAVISLAYKIFSHKK